MVYYCKLQIYKKSVGGGVAGSRSDQCPSGALNRTSGPALRDGGARCAPPSADAPCNLTLPPNRTGRSLIRQFPIFPCRECRGEQCSPANPTQQRFFRKVSHMANGHGRTMCAPTVNIRLRVGGGVAGSRSDQCPSGALNRTSGPALRDGGARCAPPSADAPCNISITPTQNHNNIILYHIK